MEPPHMSKMKPHLTAASFYSHFCARYYHWLTEGDYHLIIIIWLLSSAYLPVSLFWFISSHLVLILLGLGGRGAVVSFPTAAWLKLKLTSVHCSLQSALKKKKEIMFNTYKKILLNLGLTFTAVVQPNITSAILGSRKYFRWIYRMSSMYTTNALEVNLKCWGVAGTKWGIFTQILHRIRFMPTLPDTRLNITNLIFLKISCFISIYCYM